MKKLFAALMFLLSSSTVFASTTTVAFPLQATIPAATSVEFLISEVKGDVFSSHSGTSLNWDTAGTGMGYDPINKIWAGDKYFAIDFSPVKDGEPAPGNYGTITFTYGSQVVPAGQPADEGLNKRATIAASKVVGASESSIFQSRAIGVGSIPSLSNSDVTGGFLRVYVGLSTGELKLDGTPVSLNSKPFSNGDTAGTYQGTLTISATLL